MADRSRRSTSRRRDSNTRWAGRARSTPAPRDWCMGRTCRNTRLRAARSRTDNTSGSTHRNRCPCRQRSSSPGPGRTRCRRSTLARNRCSGRCSTRYQRSTASPWNRFCSRFQSVRIPCRKALFRDHTRGRAPWSSTSAHNRYRSSESLGHTRPAGCSRSTPSRGGRNPDTRSCAGSTSSPASGSNQIGRAHV